jgi:isopenicillin N synthase-like dioxygenase
MDALPVIDVGPLLDQTEGRHDVAQAMDAACREAGFFCLTGHRVDPALLRRLDAAARAFFALDDQEKAAIAMAHGGRAWRGWFPVGDELTSGRPDGKEGLYLGRELAADHPAVAAGRLLHGANLWPCRPADLRPAATAWMAAMETLGQAVLRGLALGLGLDESWFERELTADPTVLFRIFHYPPAHDDGWGVGEHTDYGLITLLAQDDCGGLQVHARTGWIEVPPTPGVLVVNIGDMLDRMTAGRYRSTPHRVRNTSGRDRLSFPFFLDPSWDAPVRPLPLDGERPADDAGSRWDGTSVHVWTGTYGDYLTGKVAKVFPDLADGVGAAPAP